MRIPLPSFPLSSGLVVAAGLIAAPVATAAPGPVDPLEIGRAERIDQAVPFVSPIGEQLVFWVVQGGPERPMIARVRDGGSLAAAQELLEEPNSELPRTVSFDPAGNAFVSFGIATTNAFGREVLRPAGGSFASVSSTSSCGRFNASAYGPTGKLAFACSVETPAPAPNDRVAYGLRTAIGRVGVSSFPVTPVTDDYLQPQVAWGGDGTLGVTWGQTDTPTTRSVRLVSLTPAGAQTTTTVDTSTAPNQVGLVGMAGRPDGALVLVLADASGPYLRVKPPGSAIGPRIGLGGSGASATEPRVDAGGTVHVVLSTPTGPGMGVPYLTQTRELSPGGVLSALVDVEPASRRSVGSFLVAPDGTEHVVLAANDQPATVSSRPPGGAFGAPVTVTGPDAQQPGASLTPTGDVLIAWTRKAGTDDDRVLLGGLDSGTPPVLGGVSAPGTIVVGEPARFSGTATDAMGLRSLRWDFGDGASADAGETAHAYAAPGTYTARLTATDRAGNPTSTTREVRVVSLAVAPGAPAASPPPPGPITTVPPDTVPPDTRAPTVRISVPKRIRFAAFRRRGVRVSVRLSEPARLEGLLTGSVRRVTIRRAGDVSLAEKSAARTGARTRTLTFKPKRSLVGRRARSLRLKVTVVATDGSGNRATARRSARIVR